MKIDRYCYIIFFQAPIDKLIKLTLSIKNLLILMFDYFRLTF